MTYAAHPTPEELDAMIDVLEKRGAPATGVKHDREKPPMALIPRAAMEAEAHVLAFGKAKYGAWNWAGGMEWSRLLDAALRHIYAYADGETNDPESGLNHLAHARCCLGFLLDYVESHPQLDDRRTR